MIAAPSRSADHGGPSRVVLPEYVLTGTNVRRYASACSLESCGQQTGPGFRKGPATGKGETGNIGGKQTQSLRGSHEASL